MKEKIRFKDLNIWLKILVVYGYIALTLWVSFFIAGMIVGVVEGGL